MKALTLTQPWATLVAIGAKKFETRSWRTNYRGPLAIHAAKGYPREARLLCCQEPFFGVLAEECGVDITLPTAAIIATCTLAECRPINDDPTWPEEPELSFGDYSCPGRFCWRLTDVVRLAVPVFCKGALGLWTVPEDVLQKLKEAA